MKNMFFYGTLAHHPLLEIVLGRALLPKTAQDATLPDYASYWVKGQAHPMLAAQKRRGGQGAVSDGVIGTGCGAAGFLRGRV